MLNIAWGHVVYGLCGGALGAVGSTAHVVGKALKPGALGAVVERVYDDLAVPLSERARDQVEQVVAQTQDAAQAARHVGKQVRDVSTFCRNVASAAVSEGGTFSLCAGAVKLVGTGTEALGAYVGFFRDLGRGKF